MFCFVGAWVSYRYISVAVRRGKGETGNSIVMRVAPVDWYSYRPGDKNPGVFAKVPVTNGCFKNVIRKSLSVFVCDGKLIL